MSRLTELRNLWLYKNQFSGELPLNSSFLTSSCSIAVANDTSCFTVKQVFFRFNDFFELSINTIVGSKNLQNMSYCRENGGRW